MTLDNTVTVALIGLAGVLAVQAGNMLLAWSNSRKLQAQKQTLDAQRETLAGQDVQLHTIAVSVDGNLSRVHSALAIALQKVDDLTTLQEKTMAALVAKNTPTPTALAEVAGADPPVTIPMILVPLATVAAPPPEPHEAALGRDAPTTEGEGEETP